jgi:hypothetical protein
MYSYYELNKEHIKRINKAYYQRNRDEKINDMKEYNKSYYQRNRERILKKAKERYYKKNEEMILKRVREKADKMGPQVYELPNGKYMICYERKI